METAIKTTLARENLELQKLQQSEKSHLRMIISSAARFKMKFGKCDEREKNAGETEARQIRMYETHFPGFCYLRNGEYRKKITSPNSSANRDPTQCSNKVKSILFTDNELDIFKTMCLHLLGTHVQNKQHIQRKDGRLCSYVKTQSSGSTPNTLHPMSQRIIFSSESPSKYDKMLPRYILDVKVLTRKKSTTSFKTSDIESGSDDETKKKRKHVVRAIPYILIQVPIFVNNEIRMIINSVLEALESVESPKLKELLELASSPEELRNLLKTDEAQEYIAELAKNPLVTKPTSYDFVMAHLMFDKIPEKGTLETVAQVLEVHNDPELKSSLQHIRRGILNRHLELTNPSVASRKKSSAQETPPVENSKAPAPLANSGQKKLAQTVANNKQGAQEEIKLTNKRVKGLNNLIPLQKKNQTDSKKKSKRSVKSEKRSVTLLPGKLNDNAKDHDNSSDDDGRRLARNNADTNKSHMNSLTNGQRILLGLKVASLKNRPINMHQFEGKKKIDLGALINPIIRIPVSDPDFKHNTENPFQKNFSRREKSVKSVSKISTLSTTDLENLSRALLAQLRLEIAETENRKRLNQFMANM